MSKASTFNYYCTWAMQGERSLTTDKGRHPRDLVSYDFLFDRERGVLANIPKEVRGDLIALLDDGWDVPDKTGHDREEDLKFGTLIPDAGKFAPFAALAPYDRLKALSDRVKEEGYAGLGLWIPSHHYMENLGQERGAMFSFATEYWEEKAKMCAYADIKYLKVDWGFHGRDVGYRKMMTAAVKKYAPQTIIEHVIGIFGSPYDPPLEEQQEKPFRDFMDIGRQTIAISDTYRTYDVLGGFEDVTTLMRLATLFRMKNIKTDPSLAGVINVEDSVIIAASLGMSAGVMRHPLSEELKPFDDTVRALRFQRLAPPFRLDSVENLASDTYLHDSKHFDPNVGYWWQKGEEFVDQFAPTALSRGCPLPRVIPAADGDAPYVCCMRHPETNVYCVAAINRMTDDVFRMPQADVTVYGASASAPVGVFGDFSALHIVFDSDITGKRVEARDLMDDEMCDVTDMIKADGNTLTLGADVIRRVSRGGVKNGAYGILLRLV